MYKSVSGEFSTGLIFTHKRGFMTKKDYELIARAFRETRDSVESDNLSTRAERFYALEKVARTLADALASDNARFDRARFVAACVKQ